MKKFFSRLINVFIFTLYFGLAIGSFFVSCNVDVNFEGIKFGFHLYELFIFTTLIFILKIFFDFTAQRIAKLFHKTDNSEKDIVNLIQAVLSAILLKDSYNAQKFLSKLKKFLGDSAFINWLEGNINLLRKNTHKAKALFYQASAKEKDSSLGAYSLCQIAMLNGDKTTEIETLEAMIDSASDKKVILIRLIVIEILSGKFDSAEFYLDCLKKEKYHSINRIEAIVKFCRANAATNGRFELLKKAFSLAPDISEIAIAYAEELINIDEKNTAQKVLLETWEANTTKEVFWKYTKLGKDEKERLDLAYKMVAARNDSWIGYFEFGKMLLAKEKYEDAFRNFLTAYGKNKSQEIVNCLTELAPLLPNPKPLSAKEVLDGNLEIQNIDMKFVCKTCKCISEKWHPICWKCQSIDSFEFVDVNKAFDQSVTGLLKM